MHSVVHMHSVVQTASMEGVRFHCLLHRTAAIADQVLQALSHEPVEELATCLGETDGVKAAQLHLRLAEVARGTTMAWKAEHWRLAVEIAGDSSEGKELQLFVRSRFN